MSTIVREVDVAPDVWVELVFSGIGALPGKVDVINTGQGVIEYSMDDDTTVFNDLDEGDVISGVVGSIWVKGSNADSAVSLIGTFAEDIVITSSGDVTADVAELQEAVTDLRVSEMTQGWDDLLGKFDVAAKGGNAPSVSVLSNGYRGLRFNDGNSLFVDYHTLHNGIEGSAAFPHIHMFCGSDMNAGETVIWRGYYVMSKGYGRGGSLLDTREEINLTYTAPVGGVPAGYQIVLEGTDVSTEGLLLPEPDTTIQFEWEKIGGSYGGDVYGIEADLHYQTKKDNTPNRNYPFGG